MHHEDGLGNYFPSVLGLGLPKNNNRNRKGKNIKEEPKIKTKTKTKIGEKSSNELALAIYIIDIHGYQFKLMYSTKKSYYLSIISNKIAIYIITFN